MFFLIMQLSIDRYIVVFKRKHIAYKILKTSKSMAGHHKLKFVFKTHIYLEKNIFAIFVNY